MSSGLIGAGRHDEARALAKAPDVTLGDVLNVLEISVKDLTDVAGIAEALADRISGPEPDGGADAAQRPELPGMVDGLHAAASRHHAPTSRIRRALSRIERRLSN